MQTHDSIHSMLIQQLFNLFHNFLPSFFWGGKVTTISQTKANFPAFFCMIVFRAQPSRRLRLTGPRARYSQKNDVRNRQKSQKIIIRILSPHPNDNLSAEKKRARSRKNYSVPVFRNLPPRMRLPESGRHSPRVRQVSAPAIRPAASTCRIRFFHRRYSPKTDTPSI